MSIEVGSITFTNAESGTLTFELPFTDTSFQILASARDSGDSGGVDVNIWVDNATTTASSVTVKSSAIWTGVVDIFAVKIG
jgi:hypothetical protein